MWSCALLRCTARSIFSTRDDASKHRETPRFETRNALREEICHLPNTTECVQDVPPLKYAKELRSTILLLRRLYRQPLSQPAYSRHLLGLQVTVVYSGTM